MLDQKLRGNTYLGKEGLPLLGNTDQSHYILQVK